MPGESSFTSESTGWSEDKELIQVTRIHEGSGEKTDKSAKNKITSKSVKVQETRKHTGYREET